MRLRREQSGWLSATDAAAAADSSAAAAAAASAAAATAAVALQLPALPPMPPSLPPPPLSLLLPLLSMLPVNRTAPWWRPCVGRGGAEHLATDLCTRFGRKHGGRRQEYPPGIDAHAAQAPDVLEASLDVLPVAGEGLPRVGREPLVLVVRVRRHNEEPDKERRQVMRSGDAESARHL